MTKPAALEPVKAKHLFRGNATDFKAILAADSSTVPSEIELLQTGEWDTPWHGKFTIDSADLLEYVQHFNDGVRKGVPIDLEHNSSGGAFGWVESLEIKANDVGGESLWAKISWTPAGEQKIKDREYRFFSPEFADVEYQDPETGEYMDNVLIGGGLTNRPLFKGLTAIAANDNNGNSKKGLTANSQQNTIYLTQGSESNMNLAELLAKAPADLTDEEKAFVVEHKAELTDEQVTTLTEAGVLEAEGDDADGEGDGEDEDGNDDDGAGAGDDDGNGDDDGAGGEDDGNGEGKQASQKGKGAYISAAEAKQLRADAAAGRKASEQLARKASEEHVATLCFSETNKDGKLPIAAKDQVADFYHGLDQKQQKQFNDIVAKRPSYKLFGEIAERNSTDAPVGSAQEQVQKKANDLIEADKTNKLTKASAIRKVLASDKTLAGQYNEERAAQRGAK